MDEIFEQSLILLSFFLTTISGAYLLWSILGTFSTTNSRHLQVVGQITELKDGAKRKESDNFEWDDLSNRGKAYNKDTIFTGPQSEMTLNLKSGGMLKIGSNTLIFLSQDLIDSLGKPKITQISLIKGKVDYTAQGNNGVSTSPINIDLGSTTVSGEGASSFQIIRQGDQAQIVPKQGKIQVIEGVGMQARQIPLTSHETTLLKNISVNNSKKAEVQRQKNSEPLVAPLPSETDHVEVRGSLSQAAGEIPSLAESVLFNRTTLAPLVASAPEMMTPEEPKIVIQAPKVAVHPAPVVFKKATKALNIIPDHSGISGKALVSQAGFTLEPTGENIFFEKLSPIKINWKTDVKDMGQFNLQFSTAPHFEAHVLDYKINQDELSMTKDTKAHYSFDFQPNKFAHLRDFLEDSYKNRFIFWRIVPVDQNGSPQGSTETLPVQKMTFQFSKAAEIKCGIGMYSEPTDSNSIVIAKWTIKNVIPSKYQVTLSANGDLSDPLCQKTIAKDVFSNGGLKPKGPIGLTFNEQSILENSDDCKIDLVLKSKKKLYFGVEAFDLAGQEVRFTNPAKAQSSLNIQ